MPNAQQTRGLSALIKVVSLGHITITSCYTNLDQNSASASRRSSNFIISTRYQHQNIDQTPASKSRLNFNFKILTKPCGQSLASKLDQTFRIISNLPDIFGSFQTFLNSEFLHCLISSRHMFFYSSDSEVVQWLRHAKCTWSGLLDSQLSGCPVWA